MLENEKIIDNSSKAKRWKEQYRHFFLFCKVLLFTVPGVLAAWYTLFQVMDVQLVDEIKGYFESGANKYKLQLILFTSITYLSLFSLGALVIIHNSKSKIIQSLFVFFCIVGFSTCLYLGREFSLVELTNEETTSVHSDVKKSIFRKSLAGTYEPVRAIMKNDEYFNHSFMGSTKVYYSLVIPKEGEYITIKIRTLSNFKIEGMLKNISASKFKIKEMESYRRLEGGAAWHVGRTWTAELKGDTLIMLSKDKDDNVFKITLRKKVEEIN
ncbi:hypothetical protein [Pseudoalteromonas rubra]|uniref:hypothetical protein n=1 Tax=Pseudoalteromonas rubra TaxID=43658 RepID=UPI000F795DE9|nr:hypothetical protein [Pseudoalteromonas rubra]